MFLFVYEIFTIITLIVAGLTGVWALKSLRDPETSYRFINLFRRDIPFHRNADLGRFLLFFVLTASTFSSFLAAFLRTTWIGDVGWSNAGTGWAYWWLTGHCIDGIVFTCLHLLVYFRQMRVYPNDY